ncbi:TonB-dependent receptor [Aliifodinibius sp. S!AR15-10]|uniref:TonB-dependent receptor n=1 Tax=Aliifodinibius sp. S!AR15-10 TaxID=2950437 RepID=UPI0028605BA1|nr:TonB-dependent receptor [Aliifodinibius sp. S!AR15-10]MDR8389783.1 TonB-dependent receptor [Aliifodinibius sp. S!AR15-10]
MPKTISCIWTCLILLAFSSSNLKAQEQSQDQYSFEFRGVPLSHVLDKIAIETGIDMAYDPALVKDITIYKRLQDQQVSEILQNILTDTSLDFLTLSSGTIVIVRTVHEKPAYGSFYGKVVDQETGDPLPGASVMLADASGGTSTSESGNFSINRLVSGTYRIIFSYIGYEPLQKTVEIHPNQNLQQQIALEPKPVDFTPIVVTGHVPQMPFNRSQGEAIASDSEWEPNGRLQNAIHSLSLLPGVQYGLPMTDLHLQGGQGGEHRILLDGVPIYNPYSFGKMFSAFSPYAISKVELHKAGYGVPQGSQIAGLVNLKHDLDNPKQPSAMLQVDPLSLNGRADLQLSTGADSSSLDIMAAGRTNYWDLYQEPSLQQTLQEWDALDPLVTNLLINSDADASLYQPREHHSDVRFYDLHLASRYNIDPYRTLSASFYTGENSVNTDLLRQAPENEELPQYLYAQDVYRWNNVMGQITYDHFVSSRFDLRSQLSFSSNRFNHRYRIGTSAIADIPDLNLIIGNADAAYSAFSESSVQSRIPTQRNANRIQHIAFRTSGTYSFSPHFNLDGGVQLDFVKSRVDLSELFYLRTLSDQESTFYSGYLNGNWRLGEYWKLTAGNRLTLVQPVTQFYSEPRASLQYDRPESSIGYWSARLSGGLYRQFINQFDITNPGPTSLVPSIAVWSHAGTSKVPKAWHLSSSFHLEPSTTTSLKLEGFYKWQPTTYIASYENLLQGVTLNRSDFSAFAEATDMKSLGVGLRAHQSIFDTKLKLMAGYDYNYNRINLDTQFGRSMPAPWNEPHRFQFRILSRLFPGFSSVLKWQTILGRTWGFRQAYYNFLFYEGGQNFEEYSFNNPENDKLPPFHQLDVSLIYAPEFDKFGMEVRLDLINLLDHQNTIDWSLQPTEPGGQQYQKSKRTMPGFSPSLSIKIEY